METLYTLPCQQCEVIFTAKRNHARFCSTNCRVKSAHKKKRKELADIKLESGCCVCGYNKCHAALQFDHINPLEKAFNIGDNTDKKPLQVLLDEVSKCRVICANCHAEHTYQEQHHLVTRLGAA